MTGLQPALSAHIPDILLAIGALGTTSFALVDGTKAFWGGTSNLGYGQLKAVYNDMAPALTVALGTSWDEVLRGYWLNGMARDQQISTVMSAMRLGLNHETSRQLAPHAQIAPAALDAVVDYLMSGVIGEATPTAAAQKQAQDKQAQALNALGRMDAYYRLRLNAAFDRADHAYRNQSRVVAGAVAVGLALVAGAMQESAASYPGHVGWYFLAGLIAVPLAPVAKDIATALTNAAASMKAIAGKA